MNCVWSSPPFELEGIVDDEEVVFGDIDRLFFRKSRHYIQTNKITRHSIGYFREIVAWFLLKQNIQDGEIFNFLRISRSWLFWGIFSTRWYFSRQITHFPAKIQDVWSFELTHRLTEMFRGWKRSPETTVSREGWRSRRRLNVIGFR